MLRLAPGDASTSVEWAMLQTPAFEAKELRSAAAELRGPLLHGQQTRTFARRSPAGMNDKSGNIGAETGEILSATAVFVKFRYDSAEPIHIGLFARDARSAWQQQQRRGTAVGLARVTVRRSAWATFAAARKGLRSSRPSTAHWRGRRSGERVLDSAESQDGAGPQSGAQSEGFDLQFFSGQGGSWLARPAMYQGFLSYAYEEC